MIRKTGVLFFSILICLLGNAQLLSKPILFTAADTLRGTITETRKGWNVLKYALQVKVDIPNKSISGKNKMTFVEEVPIKTIQVDLQQPLTIDSILLPGGQHLRYQQNGNAWMVELDNRAEPSRFPHETYLTIYYHGVPTEAKNAPWDGGLIWKEDASNNPFIATACQGIGASVWWPCKDHQSDEPDLGMTIAIEAPDSLSAVSNGRLKNVSSSNAGNKIWTWEVTNPINSYAVTMNIGNYTHWKDTLQGEGGILEMEFWALNENVEKAKKQFAQAKPMLQCFEYWFGKYPFYKDGYKLIETPFLGMEHQSAIAYGNGYKNGYRGRDLSSTGWGLKWDYIIVHESGHEWFGNSITTYDIADMWVHEGFTMYSEVVYTECQSGKEAAYDYAYGLQKRNSNDRPIIGSYGVNNEGSGDMYSKGATIIHSIRNMMNDDEKFRGLLRNIQSTFFHKIVTSKDIETFIMKETGLQLETFFDQYLRTANIPVLEYSLNNKKRLLCFRLTNTVDNLVLPLSYSYNNKSKKLLANTKWTKMKLTKDEWEQWNPTNLQRNYLLAVRRVEDTKSN